MAICAFGQATDGNITGNVTDATGAVIPDVAIELENVATAVKRATTSDQDGIYRFNNVPVGRYRITARAPSFTTSTLENINVTLNRTTTANFELAVGTVATQVEVVEAAAQIDTTTATVGSAFSQQEAIYNPLSALPLGIYNLALMGAGVASSGGVGLGEGPSVGGQRPRQNSFMIEGVDNNRTDVTGANVRVPNEAVAEFSMLQNQFSAEFGHSNGGQFNVAIRSGTNDIHGALFWYLRNRNLNAVDEADARQGIRENPRFDENRVGGSVGGPIVKNRLFYYGLFEYNPYGAATSPSSATYSPTAEGYRLLDGIGGLSRTNYDILKQYLAPAPSASETTTVRGVSIPIGILPISFPNYSNTYNWLGSVDFNASSADQLRFRYVASKFDGIDIDTSPNLPAFAGPRQIRQRILTFSEFHTFSPTLLNELRLNNSYFADSIPAGDFSFPGLDVFPNIIIEQDLNAQLGPLPEAPQSGSQNIYQLVNNLTWNKGLHTVKAGVDVRRMIKPTTFIQRSRGDYNYSTLEQYLLDLTPDVLAERNVGGRPYWGNQWNMYWFIQDEMKLRRNVTLTLGLRHEYKGIPSDDRLQELNSVSSVPGLIEFRAPRAQKDAFAPRVGLTWSPGTSGKTVVRMGGGMAYDNYFDNLGTLSKPPQLESTARVEPNDLPNFLANGGIPGTAPGETLDPAEARLVTGTWIPDQRLPVSYQWTFGVERVIARDYTFNIRYLGTRGSRLFVQQRLNSRAVVTPTRSLPTYLQQPSQSELDSLGLTLDELTAEFNAGGFYVPRYLDAGFENLITAFQNIGNSTYHGLATEFQRRFARGLLFKTAYTWSKAIDDSTADLFSTLLSPRRAQDFENLRAERSRSFLDRTHRFSFTWVYDAPWFRENSNWLAKNLVGNWVISGTYIAESPQYATVQSGIDSNMNIDAASDRAIINPQGQDRTGSDVRALTNSAGQTVAYLALNPNARYIRAGRGAYPNGGRQTLPLEGINNWDLGLAKKFSIDEFKAVELRANFVNALNHPQYIPGSLNTVQAVSSNVTRNLLIPGNPLFNDPTRTFASNARQIYLALRVTF
ncbi:MAG: carboxypeptidase regulatory-like domain-containing protein [Bryobacteraceae bacterium]|nr:carboxypeptidase regulatory-like domain-containing protein [Bryobacteraceae bacterium]